MVRTKQLKRMWQTTNPCEGGRSNVACSQVTFAERCSGPRVAAIWPPPLSTSPKCLEFGAGERWVRSLESFTGAGEEDICPGG